MNGAEPRWKRQCRFLAALNNNDTPLAWALLRGTEGTPVDPDVRIMTGGESKPAICIAVEKDLLKMTELLIKSGCSVNQCASTGSSPLHIAVLRKNLPMVHLLLNSGANVSSLDSYGRTPLHLAAASCREDIIDIVRLLVLKGSNMEHRDEWGATPLALACSSGHSSVILYLLSQGACAATSDNEGNTPLHNVCTVQPDGIELVNRLLDAGALVDGKNSRGMTALSCALMSHTSPAVVQRLLNQGADCNVYIDCLQQTAFHLAVYIREQTAVRTFVRYGGNPFVQDSEGNTVLHYALLKSIPLAIWMLRANPFMGRPRWKTLKSLETAASLQPVIVELSSVPTLQQLCSLAFRLKYACCLDSLACTLTIPPRLLHILLLSDVRL
ncbi:uncharacterized protein LOC144129307 isoform X2 [Amblyomma americanum]